MLTFQDVLNNLQENYPEDYTGPVEIPIEHLPLVKEAVGRQTFKKAITGIDNSWGVRKTVAICPTCDYYMDNYEFISSDHLDSSSQVKVVYCEHCGQAVIFD